MVLYSPGDFNRFQISKKREKICIYDPMFITWISRNKKKNNSHCQHIQKRKLGVILYWEKNGWEGLNRVSHKEIDLALNF